MYGYGQFYALGTDCIYETEEDAIADALMDSSAVGGDIVFMVWDDESNVICFVYNGETWGN